MKALIPFALLALLMLAPLDGLTSRAEAGYYEEIYTVYWDCSCPVGPTICDQIVGEWTVDCNGNWNGSGWRPGEYNCSYFTFTLGNECYWQASNVMPPALGEGQGLFATASAAARESNSSRPCPRAGVRPAVGR